MAFQGRHDLGGLPFGFSLRWLRHLFRRSLALQQGVQPELTGSAKYVPKYVAELYVGIF